MKKLILVLLALLVISSVSFADQLISFSKLSPADAQNSVNKWLKEQDGTIIMKNIRLTDVGAPYTTIFIHYEPMASAKSSEQIAIFRYIFNYSEGKIITDANKWLKVNEKTKQVKDIQMNSGFVDSANIGHQEMVTTLVRYTGK